MNCPLKRVETTDLLLEYSAKRLDAAKAAMLERHVEVCAECSAFLAGQTAVWDALDAWEPPPVSMDFNRRLWQRIDRAAELPWYRSSGQCAARGKLETGISDGSGGAGDRGRVPAGSSGRESGDAECGDAGCFRRFHSRGRPAGTDAG